MSRKDLRPVSPIKEAATESQGAAAGPAVEDARAPKVAAAARPAILVLGMHRSGTSATTRTLNLLGATVPDNLMPPDAQVNATGFWESEDLRALHDELLASAGSSWDDWLPFNPGWYRSPVADTFRQRVRSLLEKDLSGASLCVIKDPRICRFLPFWLDVLTEAGLQPRCILVTRDPLEVAASLRRRDGFSRSKSLMLWLRHVLDAEFASRELPRAFVSYQQLLGDWRAVAAVIGQRLGIDWPRLNPATEAQIDDFLDPRHRHHEVVPQQVSHGETVTEWVRCALAAVQCLQTGQDEIDVHRQLDTLRGECDRASQLLGALLWSEANRQEQAQEDQLQQLRTSLLERDRELADRLAAQAELQRTARELQQRLVLRDAYVDELTSSIDSLNDRIRVLEPALVERDQEIEVLRTQARDLGNQLSKQYRDWEATADRQQQALVQSEAMLSETHEEVTRLRAQRRDLAGRLSYHQTHLSWQAVRPLLWIEDKAPWLMAGAAGTAKTLAWLFSGQLPRRIALRHQAAEITAVGLFDEDWYVGEHPEVLHSGYRPLYHWLEQGAAQGWSPHPLFDTAWYLKHCTASDRTECNPLRHYLRHGDAYSPHPLFDPKWYASQCPAAARDATPALVHYLRCGAALGLDPHPLFDTRWYLQRYPQVAEAGDNPLAHYVREGADAGADPNPLFHTQWYRMRTPGLCAAGMNPLVHFWQRPQGDSTDPNPLFDTGWYLKRYPSVAASGINPLLHYLAEGADAGFDPHPLFDTQFYRRACEEVGGGNPLSHYLSRCGPPWCDPSAVFDTRWYLSLRPNLARAGGNPLIHYLSHGATVGASPNPVFDSTWYLAAYPEVATTRLNPLYHYQRWGAEAGCRPAPYFDPLWYLKAHPEASAFGNDALGHYLRVGKQVGLTTQAMESDAPSQPATRAFKVPGWSGEWSSVAPHESSDSGRVLIIDQRPPTPDRDSGSVRMMKLIGGLVDAGVTVCFIGDRPAPEVRYRQAIEHLGVEVLVGREAALDHLSAQGLHYRAAILSRPETVESYLPLVRAFAVNAKAIYDSVDLHWVRSAREAELSGDPEMGRRADHYRRLELANASAADLTLVVSDEERRQLREQVPGLAVEVLGNIHEVADEVPGFELRQDLFFIGGFEHAPNQDAMVYFLREVLPLIVEQIPAIRLLIAGSDMPDRLRELASDRVDILGYLPEVMPLLRRARVFVAPLRYGAGVKGKVGQSLAAGLPVVTTSVGAEGLGLEDRRHALIADDTEAFAAAVIALYTDAQLWQRLSESGRALVAARFSASAARDRLLSIVGHDASTPQGGT